MFGKRDPVCGAKVKNTEYILKYGDKVYYFDCQACKATFEEEPTRFVRKRFKKDFLKWFSNGAGKVPKSCHDTKR